MRDLLRDLVYLFSGEWRKHQRQKARAARKAPENAFGVALVLKGTPELKRHKGAYSTAKGAV